MTYSNTTAWEERRDEHYRASTGRLGRLGDAGRHLQPYGERVRLVDFEYLPTY